jgi:hypothetical protein
MSSAAELALGRLAELMDVVAAPEPAPEAARELAELARVLPGRARAIAGHLGAHPSAGAVEGLLALPPATPGGLEGLAHAFARGTTRRFPGGRTSERMAALELRSSRARRFPALVARARAGFSGGYERLDDGTSTIHRVAVFPDRDPRTATARAHELVWLHDAAGRLRGLELWINGWCLPAAADLGPPRRTVLLRAWAMGLRPAGPGGAG